jgi:DNA polymerase
MSKETELKELISEIFECKQCDSVDFDIASKAVNTDIGKYPMRSILVVGDMPGREDVNKGKPFIGPVGDLLKTVLKRYGLGDKCAFTNVNQCKSAKGTFNNDEVTCCTKYLARLIQLLRPKVILTLGRAATNAVLGFRVAIMKAVGNVYELNDGSCVIPAIHPAIAVRNGRFYNSNIYLELHSSVALARAIYDDYDNLTSFDQNEEAGDIVFQDISGMSMFDME